METGSHTRTIITYVLPYAQIKETTNESERQIRHRWLGVLYIGGQVANIGEFLFAFSSPKRL
jgi:hypothetical protein